MINKNIMKKVVFTQDLGVDRSIIDELLLEGGLISDWSMADGNLVLDVDNVVGISTANIPLERSILSNFPSLKTISMSFTGYDHVDKVFCIEKGISVYNVPSYSTDSVAELGVGLAISLLREIPKGNSEIKNGKWNESLSGSELARKKCGIIGTGTIGCRLGELLHAFKCELYGWSRSEKQKFKELNGKYVSLTELFSDCDLIYITTALNEGTKDLVSKDQFDLMKPSAFLINIARGPIVNREALIDAVANHKIAGFATDVYDYEPLSSDDELRTLENSILTPHVAYRTKEALSRKASVTIENIFRGLKNDPTNKVI